VEAREGAGAKWAREGRSKRRRWRRVASGGFPTVIGVWNRDYATVPGERPGCGRGSGVVPRVVSQASRPERTGGFRVLVRVEEVEA